MPELAEVELIRRDLESAYLGKSVTNASSDASTRFRDGARASGTLVEVGRAAKLLTLGLASNVEKQPDTWLCVHLGMTGRLYGSDMEQPSKWRVRWQFEELSLTLGDVRGFGYARVIDERPVVTSPVPGDKEFPTHLVNSLARHGAPIFLRLLDQRVAPGIGSYLAQEALWHARISPAARSLTSGRCARLSSAIEDTVSMAITNGGLSMRDYRRLDGSRGMSLDDLSCYQRAGQPCIRCGKIMTRSVIGGRGVSHCTRCQR